MTDERKDVLFKAALDWVSEHAVNDEELYRALSETIGMTDDEIHECGFDYLDEYMDEDSTPRMGGI